jgi:hypothetical protein
MIDLWGGRQPSSVALEPESRSTGGGERHLLNGPARPGEGLDQGDIDSMMFGAADSEYEMEAVKAEASPPLQPATTLVAAAASEFDVDAPLDPLAPLKSMSDDERVALFT